MSLRLKRTVMYVAGVALIAAGALLAFWQLRPLGGPRLRFEQSTFDFGTIDQARKVKRSFAFTNVGNETLRIAEVRPS